MKQDLYLKKIPKNILIISMRYLGDVLLTTPLIHSLRQSYPDAKISVLVYSNTAGILEGNPDIDEIIPTPQRPGFLEYMRLVKKIFRQYDLSIACQTGDRRLIYAVLSGLQRVAFVPKRTEKGGWKRYLVNGWVELDGHSNHTVLELLKLSGLLNCPPNFSLIPPRRLAAQPPLVQDLPSRYAVLHIHPQWTFKRWSAGSWVEIGCYLNSLGITPVLSGSAAPDEIEYIHSVKQHLPSNSISIAGKVSLAELAEIISQSELFIGPDTGITHLAAATGVPVIALFGPTNPLVWGPWPYGYNSKHNPYKKTGSQSINNIDLLQGKAPSGCVPCQEEGCDNNRESHSLCLDDLSVDDVTGFINTVLNKK